MVDAFPYILVFLLLIRVVVETVTLSMANKKLHNRIVKLEEEYKELHDEHEYLLNDIAEMGNPKDA
jgi:cell division protein FtsB